MPYRLVVVEDEAEIADLLRVVLTCPQVELYAAANGREGLALIEDIGPDLAILDVMLPGEWDGWDVFDALRASLRFRDMPVIILTVLRQQAERHPLFRDNMLNQYLTKPFDTMALRGHVERMLGQPGLWRTPSRPLRDVFGLLSEAAEALDLDPPDDD
ncbi:MAG: response regulator [Anaerolineae bacterium]|nr:response regulator [Anaerolineae bacterium]